MKVLLGSMMNKKFRARIFSLINFNYEHPIARKALYMHIVQSRNSANCKIVLSMYMYSTCLHVWACVCVCVCVFHFPFIGDYSPISNALMDLVFSICFVGQGE